MSCISEVASTVNTGATPPCLSLSWGSDAEDKTYTVNSHVGIQQSITEEFIHMFQDNIYTNGIGIYANPNSYPGRKGSANIEFEAKFITALSSQEENSIITFIGCGINHAEEYCAWMRILGEKKARGEISWEDIERGYNSLSYQDFMEDYAAQWDKESAYRTDLIDPTMQPKALKYILNTLYGR